MSVKKRIFNIVRRIPKGKVMTYGQIAKLIGLKDVRVVGWTLHTNKDKKIPCYRVIKSDGSIATGYAFGGQKEQQKMLERDGMKFSNGHCELAIYLYYVK
jgi:methylated-DNA-protein-cysteine methyltransferase-like protein